MALATQTDNELSSLLRAELSSEEQRLFLDGFQAYLQHDPRKDFVVDLDDVYQWLGFSRKDPAKRTITTQLTEGVHFKTINNAPRLLHRSVEQTSGRGGHNKETTMMTVHGFKQLCMAANTDKARRVRDYYIAMEEVLFEYTRRKMIERETLLEAKEEETREARLMLDAKEAELQRSREELQRFKEKTFDAVPTDEIVYVNKEAAELSSDRHKVGITIDEKKRQSQLNTGSAQGSKMIFRVATNNAKLVETIATHVLRRYRCGREHYNCRVEHTIDVIRVAAAVCDTLASTYEHIGEEELCDRVTAAVVTCLHDPDHDGHVRQDEHAVIATQPESQPPPQGSADEESHVSAEEECADDADEESAEEESAEDESADSSDSTCDDVTGCFVDAMLTRTDSREDTLRVKDAWREYKAYMQAMGQTDLRLGYAAFAEDIGRYLGTCVTKSGAMRSFWRGWRINSGV